MDYSKIDFTKCKLEPLPCMMVDGTTKQLRVLAQWRAPHRNVVLRVGEPGSLVLAKTGHGSTGWQFMEGAILLTTDDACLLIDRAEQVNRFIAAETVRIEAEEEEKSWVQVPWQDVEWLQCAGAKVDFFSTLDGEWLSESPEDKKSPFTRYRADRRTFPAGYDPTMPRWVEVDRTDVVRLENAGCTIRLRSIIAKDSDAWESRSLVGADTSIHCNYQVDAHTIKPGVPLHVEPKPEWRPCTKGFANTHRADSQARFFGDSEWGNWVELHLLSFAGPPGRYEFRTTATEDVITKTKTMTCLEFAKSLVESNQEKYILVNGKCYGYRFNREHCRIETGVATDHGTVDWGPSFGFGAASDVIAVTE